MRREISNAEIWDIGKELNSKGYKRYKELKGVKIRYESFSLYFDKIQGDPFAPPSFVRAIAKVDLSPFRKDKKFWKTAFSDYISRKLYQKLRVLSRKARTGNSGYLGVPKPSPRILRRSSVETIDSQIVLRFFVGLPGKGRRIDGRSFVEIFSRKIPEAIRGVLSAIKEEREKILRHITLYLDQEYLRKYLEERGYVAFVADGAILPRESSLSENPMKNAKRFVSPNPLRIFVKLPSGREISGMGIEKGITVITGGGYHGKSTLLRAIQEGIYNHVEGDGREFVISDKRTVTIKAEDGRLVSCVDISNIISDLPSGVDTSKFSSLSASGSTSMASSINEAIEMGAKLMLIDEDTSATNMMYKDEGMEKVIRKESIRVLSTFVRKMCEKSGSSLILIMSSSSSFFKPADKVILMEEYEPKDVTSEAKAVGGYYREEDFKLPMRRRFFGVSGMGKVKVKGSKIAIKYPFGIFELETKGFERIVEHGQVRLLAGILSKIEKYKGLSFEEIARKVDEEMEKGFSSFFTPVPPDLTEVSGFDVVWALNRLPGLMAKIRSLVSFCQSPPGD